MAQTGTFQQIPGSLSQISVGADGTVWGVDSHQNIFTYDSTSGAFVQVAGQLTQIAVGNANAVWGINAQGLIFRWDSAKQTWAYIPGFLNQIAVGADGDVWGLSANTSGQCGTNSTTDISNGCTFVWHYNQQAQSWDYLDTSKLTIYLGVTQLAVGNDGAVYALIDSSPGYLDVLWYNPGTGQFQYLAGDSYAISGEGGIGRIAAGADGDLWSGSGIHFNPWQPAWDIITSDVSQVAVGSAQNVWGIAPSATGDGPVYQWNNQTASWVAVSGAMLSQIAAGADGSVWGINSSHQVFHYVGTAQPYRTLIQIPGSFHQISVAVDGTAWAVDPNNFIYAFDRQTQTWHSVSGELAQVAVGFASDVWGVNAAGEIWLQTQPGQTQVPVVPSWISIPGELTQIAVAANASTVGANGSVFGINTYGQTYVYDSTGWSNIPGTLAQLSAGVDGTVWGVNAQQQIYYYQLSTNSWINVPGSLAQVSVGNANNIWGVNYDQHVYRYDTAAQGWIQIPGALLTQIAAAFDGAVWGVNAQGGLYQWDSATQTFNFIGSGVTNVAVGNDSTVFAWNQNTGITYYWF